MKFQPTSRVAEILSDHPDLIAVFRKFGFHALANPVLRATLARRVTVEEACERHRVRAEEFLKALDDAAGDTSPGPGVAFPPAQQVSVAPSASTDKAACACGGDAKPAPANGAWVHPEMNIGEVIGRFPETKVVFSHFFGDSCFTCPSFGMEDLYTACSMHGTNVEDFVAACNQVATNARGPATAKEQHRWVSGAMTVNDILRNYPEAAPVIAHHGLDACCGGAHPVAYACQHHGADLARLLDDLDRVIQETRTPA
ncbi:MAG: DUF542 domain-containing protein [Planctomycetota bacterium]